MGLRGEGKRGRLAPAAYLDIIVGTFTGWHRRMRRIGNAGQQLAVLFVQLFSAFFEGGGAVAHFADFLLARGGVLAGFNEFADFLGFGLALSLKLLGFGE